MKLIFTSHTSYIAIAIGVIGVVLFMLYSVSTREQAPLVTSVVDTGNVRELVSVSGIAEAKQTAQLSFPVSGTAREVFVQKGDQVATGATLVTLDARALYSDRLEATAALTRAIADRDELLAGPTVFSQSVTTETLATQKAALATTRENESQKIQNAYRTLLSSGLTAYTEDATKEAIAPTIGGTYRCDQEGTYIISVYASAASSGYSFTLSGLETGTYSVYTDQPGPLGTCGLTIIFDANSRYTNSRWLVDIPNQRSASYTTNRNTYELTVTQANTAITLAEQAVALAEATATNQNAPARSEAVARADAAVIQAQARRNRIDVAIAERTLTAPFAGTITNISVLPGETVTTAPVVTLLAESNFEVVARIPEIDIGKIQTGQPVEMKFDTRPLEIQTGVVSFVSPRSTQIDGVAYFEAVIQLETLPDWMRSGLNADIEIVVKEISDTPRVSRRFIIKDDSGNFVQKLNGETITVTPIDIIFTGNDGFVAITGVTAGDTLVAP
jgi:multidrug efflux pump subunit AcrA (membrane-fusion protein)